jgi:3-oxoacyl-[acyl-carrier-protein] synthase II
MTAPRRVVVTGLGAFTPVGHDVASTWAALLAGRSGVCALDDATAGGSPVRIAATASREPEEFLSRTESRRMDRCQQFGLIAARQAWADAALDRDSVPPGRLGVAVASAIGGVITIFSQYDTHRTEGWQRMSPFSAPRFMPNGAAGWIGLEFSAKAGVHCVVSACASGTEAIGYGINMIRHGRADVVLAGGTEAPIHPAILSSFAAMRALSTRNEEPPRASRPFTKDRDGFVLGEGAGIMVLEAEEHALARGARVYAEAAGSGYSADAYSIAQPDPSGEGAVQAMRNALADADLTPADIAHINAHATSTPAGDLMEARAIRLAVGSHPVLTATKSMVGHSLGGAGGIEAVVAVRTLQERLVHPTVNLDDVDDEIEADIVRFTPRPLSDGPMGVLSTSFGFGGHNVAVAFRSR